ncbi:MAG: hypothetical protein ACE5IZ_02075 [Dehalococcoidia bacterium]
MNASANDLVRLSKAVSWLDRARWLGKHPGNAVVRWAEGAGPQARILGHWLSYITDRMRKWEDVWHDGALIFSRVATDYATSKPAYAKVNEFLESYREQDRSSGKMRAWRQPNGGEPLYRCRFPTDEESIYRTLKLLARLEWSFADYLKHLIDRFRSEPKGLRRIAHCLDILTYRIRMPEDEAFRLLQSEKALADNFARWDKSAYKGHKRLWAALRDYRKPGGNESCYHYLELCELCWPSESFGLEQLELPGDVWNIRFFECLVEPLAKKAEIPVSDNSALNARRIYEVVKSVEPETSFYPEQFDVSFDFAQRMCENWACWYCPFWKGERSCASHHAEICRQREGTPCALTLVTCGYSMDSGKSGCPFCQREADDLCDGLISQA